MLTFERSCGAESDPRRVGDPVDTLTGAVTDVMLDFRLTGPIELRWNRYYDSSLCQQSFSLGTGCAHEFDRTLTIDEAGLLYIEPLRRTLRFPALRDDGDQCANHGITVRRVSSTSYLLYQYAQPAMEFVFAVRSGRARLTRLLRDSWQVRFMYDRNQRLIRIVDSADRSIAAREDAAGRLTRLAVEATSTAAGYLLVEYHYDDRGNLTATTNHLGHGYAFAYDEENRMILRRGRKGFHFHYTYDNKSRCIRALGDDDLYGVTLEYKVPGRLTEVTRPDGGVWHYKFNQRGELDEIRDPVGGSQKFVRDPGGRLLLEIDPNRNATRFVYDVAGAVVATLDPFGRRRPFPPDPNFVEPLTHRVPTSAAEYEHGRLFDVENIVLPTDDRLLELPGTVSVRALVSTRAKQESTPDTQRPFVVTPLRILWWPKPRRGRIFNDFGQLVRQQDMFGRHRQWSYDESGNVAEFVDFDGGHWKYDYGSWHFLRTLRSPIGAAVHLSYTSYGEVASCVDPLGTRSDYRYNLKDHLIEVRRHGVVRDTYVRDAAGNLISKRATDGRELFRCEIGPANRPVTRTFTSGEEHSFEYDDVGRRVAAATKKCRVTFAYDNLGNRVLDDRDGIGVAHTFQGWRRLAESVFAKRYITRYDWRDATTLTITDPGGKSHTFSFLKNGLVERRFSNGSSETAQYDNHGRCLFKHARHRNGQVWRRLYHWSGEGELRRVEDNKFGDALQHYDAAHRLQTRVSNGRTERYVMDSADNLFSQPGLAGVSVRDGNRLRTANDSEFDYNDRNHIAARRTRDGTTRYVYDETDQLVTVDSSAGTWTAEYDALGRRTRKVWAGKITEYYWDTDRLIGELCSDGRLRLYIYTDSLALSPVMFLEYNGLDSSPEECRRYFIFSDQLGTPCLIEDEDGAEVWSARLTAFGHVEALLKADLEFNFRFPGHYYDPELKLHYNRFRYYDPLLGRYLQSDQWGIAGGYNLYAYRTNPLESVDVRGLGEDGTPGCPKAGEDGSQDESPRPPPGFPTEDDVRATLPVFDGATTHGVLVTNDGHVVPLESGTRPAGYSNYESAAHVEGQAAIFMRENNSTGGVVYHNNPNGTCGYCNSHVPTLLPEGAQMVVVPPEGARANNSRATGEPTIYTGNDKTPKQPK